MPKARFIQNNWTGGQVSELMAARHDVSWRESSAPNILNFKADPRGALLRTSDVDFISVLDKDKTHRLHGVIFDNQQYILVFGWATISLYEVVHRGPEYGGIPGIRFHEELTSPFRTLLEYIDVVQMIDRIFLFSPEFPPWQLLREEIPQYDGSTEILFRMEPMSLKNGPWEDENTDPEATLEHFNLLGKKSQQFPNQRQIDIEKGGWKIDGDRRGSGNIYVWRTSQEQFVPVLEFPSGGEVIVDGVTFTIIDNTDVRDAALPNYSLIQRQYVQLFLLKAAPAADSTRVLAANAQARLRINPKSRTISDQLAILFGDGDPVVGNDIMIKTVELDVIGRYTKVKTPRPTSREYFVKRTKASDGTYTDQHIDEDDETFPLPIRIMPEFKELNDDPDGSDKPYEETPPDDFDPDDEDPVKTNKERVWQEPVYEPESDEGGHIIYNQVSPGRWVYKTTSYTADDPGDFKGEIPTGDWYTAMAIEQSEDDRAGHLPGNRDMRYFALLYSGKVDVLRFDETYISQRDPLQDETGVNHRTISPRSRIDWLDFYGGSVSQNNPQDWLDGKQGGHAETIRFYTSQGWRTGSIYAILSPQHVVVMVHETVGLDVDPVQPKLAWSWTKGAESGNKNWSAQQVYRQERLSRRWQSAAYGQNKGLFPTTGCVAKGRLWIASRRVPNRVHGSVPDDFLNFRAGPEDDDSFNILIADNLPSSPERLRTDGSSIMVMSTVGIHSINEDLNGRFTPSAFRADKILDTRINPYITMFRNGAWFIAVDDDLKVFGKENTGQFVPEPWTLSLRLGENLRLVDLGENGDSVYGVTDDGEFLEMNYSVREGIFGVTRRFDDIFHGMVTWRGREPLAVFESGNDLVLGKFAQPIDSGNGFGLSTEFDQIHPRSSYGGVEWIAGRGRVEIHDFHSGRVEEPIITSHPTGAQINWDNGYRNARFGFRTKVESRVDLWPVEFDPTWSAVRGVTLYFRLIDTMPFDVLVDGVRHSMDWVIPFTGVKRLRIEGEWNQGIGPTISIVTKGYGAIRLLSVTQELDYEEMV